MLWLHMIQYSGFVLAQISNATLVWLILTKAQKLFGTYRHVMCTFAVYSLVYAWVEVLAQPIMHIKGPCFIVFMESPLKYFGWIANHIVCLYCASFALCISLLAVQFFYRYVAMCRPELLMKIEGFKLIYIFIPCLICFVLWFEFVYYGMANTVEKQIYMREELEDYYEEDSTRVAFIAPMYWSIGRDGEKQWIIGDVIGSIGCVCIIVACFSTIVVCASTIYLTMKSSTCHMSARTLELNRQLFVTLTFQTILPFLMMYSPVGLLITLPVFEVYVASLANIVPATAAIYPSLEPLIAIVCIKEFRRTLTCKFKMRRTET
ncbi:Protein CBG11368 [Caenorhabditis briggsae]|uniref:Serpentine receptor class r-10 n=1 Tax=Caenorhabditis briggsae TaxID=6238 RepID=A8XD66_CAEBR|nr:Protein CBG11368 [Caenorhabditis briggsae]CAP30585.1 Protein CBG11368 [Caenorhabditis briggsae]